MKYSILAILLIAVTYWELKGESRKTLSLVTAFCGVSAMVFRQQGFLVSVAGMLIAWAAFICLLNSRPTGHTHRSVNGVVLVLIGLSLLGLAVGALVDPIDALQENSASMELASVTSFSVVAALFVAKWASHFPDGQDFAPHSVVSAFLAASVLQAVTVVVQFVGLQDLVPSFLIASVNTVDESGLQLDVVERFGGLIGDYELVVDLSLITIAVALLALLNGSRKLLPISALASAVALGIFSGTRSFLVALALIWLFITVAAFIGLKKQSSRFRVLGLCAAVLAVVAGAYSMLLSDLGVVQRMQVAIQLMQEGGGYERTLNRNYSDAIDKLSESVGPVGAGAYLHTTVGGNEIISHNVFLAAYARYGIVGPLALLALATSLAFKTARAFFRARTDSDRLKMIVIISFGFALLLQQLKVSALRSMPGVLVYTFWFMVLVGQLRVLDHTKLRAR